jgi:hypothetical protein
MIGLMPGMPRVGWLLALSEHCLYITDIDDPERFPSPVVVIFVSELPLMMLLDGREPGKTHAWYMFANDYSYSYSIPASQ